MSFKRNLSPAARERHYAMLMDMFARDAWIVTEWRDGCVYRTQAVGKVVCLFDAMPFKPGSGARV